MRYLPLTPTDRRDMLAMIGAQVGRRAVPGRAAVGAAAGQGRRPARPSGRARGRARLPGLRGEERLAGHGAVLHRRRRLPPSCALDRRLHDPARRVPDLLYAVPARDHAGHAAVPVRVPDPGEPAHRHGGGQRLDVRRLDGGVRGRADGQPHHAPHQGADLGRAASALSHASSRPPRTGRVIAPSPARPIPRAWKT